MIDGSYLTQVGQVANGITAFALAQNLSATIAIFSIKPLRDEIIKASRGWIVIPTLLAIALYCALVIGCLCLELMLVSDAGRKDLLWVLITLAVGRGAAIIASTMPFSLAVIAVRKRSRSNASEKPATSSHP